MDEMKQHQQYVSGRQGFALMITLSVLSVVIALTVVMLSYFNEVKQDSDNTKALIQANVYYADMLEQFGKFKDKKSLVRRLYRFPVFLQSPDKRFRLSLRCTPLAAGVNINWLAMERVEGKQHLFTEAQILFETLSQEYNLEDTDRLLEMLLTEIAIGKKYIQKKQSRLIQKNGIISYQQFTEIIKRYEIEVDDRNVGRIPWQKYFSFSQKSEKVDAEYSSAELISFLFDIDLNTVREWMSDIEKTSLANFVNQNGGSYAEKKNLLAGSAFLGESRCMVNFGAGYKFTFDYIEGEAKYFEFYGKQ